MALVEANAGPSVVFLHGREISAMTWIDPSYDVYLYSVMYLAKLMGASCCPARMYAILQGKEALRNGSKPASK